MTAKLNRRSFVRSAIGAFASLRAWPVVFASDDIPKASSAQEKLFLLRYDTEAWEPQKMEGFLEKVIQVHRRDGIPATFFCKGATLELMEEQFKGFYEEVKDDGLFDIEDHSYSHIGLGYEQGKPVDVLRADYERSFGVHERVFGVRPIGISICGTSGADGPSLSGFDATEKSRAELDMVVSLGVRMINSFLSGVDGSRVFVNYRSLGHPKIMGFPSAYSDTVWMWQRQFGEPVEYITAEMKNRAEKNEHMPLMLHDWVAWLHSPDQQLSHVSKIVDAARKLGYTPVTHVACLAQKQLWA